MAQDHQTVIGIIIVVLLSTVLANLKGSVGIKGTVLHNNYYTQTSILEIQTKYDILNEKVNKLIKTTNELKFSNEVLQKENRILRGFLVERKQHMASNTIHDRDQRSFPSSYEDRSKSDSLFSIRSGKFESKDRVAFFVRADSNLRHLGNKQIIRLASVVTDTANAYNSHIGVFIAPRDGLFLFFATITAYPDRILYKIMKNDIDVVYSISENQTNKWASSSVSAIIQLYKNDHVYLQIIRIYPSREKAMIGSYSHFTGFSLT